MASLATVEQGIKSLNASLLARNFVHVEKADNTLRFVHNDRAYVPTKTGKLFHEDESFIRAVVGPVGSGKSTMCCVEIVKHCMSMPVCTDGVKRARWAVIRNTYADLESTTLATWKDWFRGLGADNLRMGFPINYYSQFNTSEGRCELQVIFLALNRDDDVRKLQSLDLSGAYINEARYIPSVVLNTLMQRVGRYPSFQMLTEGFEPKIILDTNPCDTDFWFYKRFEIAKPEGHKIFKQPPGLLEIEGKYITNPDAENLENLPANYYLKAADGVTKAEINVQLKGEYGSFVEGEPVFSSYNDDVHSVDELEFTPGLPVYMGWDYGLTPACALAQLTPRGQLQIIKEFTSEDMFLEEFLDDIILPFKETYLSDYKFISVGDPAGHTRKDTDARTCEDVLEDRGIPTDSCETNTITARLGAVNKLLTRMIGGQAAFVVSRTGCSMLRKSFQGKYCWKKVGGEKIPDKNEYSHISDALQYIAVKIMGVEKKVIPFKASFMPAGMC